MTLHHLPPFPSGPGRPGWFDADLVRDRDHLSSQDVSRIAARRHHLSPARKNEDHHSARFGVLRALLSKLSGCRHRDPAAATSAAAEATPRRTPARLAES